MPQPRETCLPDRASAQDFFKHPFLTGNLIAYIGNKRRLLPLIDRAIAKTGLKPQDGGLFVDLFAGSGAVSRLAKLRGWRVVANDWEEYARILGEAFLCTGRQELEQMFPEQGGLAAVLQQLNALTAPTPAGRYISEYYAPRSTAAADPDRERMFYTAENGSRIDAVREWIETRYPGVSDDPVKYKEKNLLLGLLLYGAATHANTSGVFKAYHRGFGGRGRDALGRIMKRIELQFPALVDGEASMLRMDASEAAAVLARQETADIVYLDPPYNQHQYGSNYHLLNTIARNDRPDIPREIVQQGRTVCKGGIRPDWTETRSDYCYRNTAAEEFRRLISRVNCKRLLISYSTEGIIPFDLLLQILGGRGRLDIVLSEYTRYRGGKQALTTETKNLEFVLIADLTRPNRVQDTRRVLNILSRKKMELFLSRTVSPAVFVDRGFQVSGFTEMPRDLCFEKVFSDGVRMQIEVADFQRIAGCRFFLAGREVEPGELPGAAFNSVLHELEGLTAVSREEELAVMLHRARYLLESGKPAAAAAVLPKIPALLKKFNDRKAHLLSLEYIRRIAALYSGIVAATDTIPAQFLTAFLRVVRLKLSAPLHRGQDPLSVQQARKLAAEGVFAATGKQVLFSCH